MDLNDVLNKLAKKVETSRSLLETEEGTKNALIMPVINALGYNVFDPTEVTPEFTADVGAKKGEKVDYAINIDSVPMILIECKSIDTTLKFKHASQLFRYFGATNARFAVLTNGVMFWFYTDLASPNRMDETPFFEFNLLDFDERDINELKKFSKSVFDLDNILSNATELKYVKEILRHIESELDAPTEDFIRFFASRVYTGRLTSSIVDQFTPLVRTAFRRMLQDALSNRLQSVLRGVDAAADPPAESDDDDAVADDGIVTTAEEIEGFHIVRALLSNKLNPTRVIMRDTKSYCGVLLDDNNRKPICRLRFNSANKYLGLFDANKTETRHAIANVYDIYAHADAIVETVNRYEGDSDSVPQD